MKRIGKKNKRASSPVERFKQKSFGTIVLITCTTTFLLLPTIFLLDGQITADFIGVSILFLVGIFSYMLGSYFNNYMSMTALLHFAACAVLFILMSKTDDGYLAGGFGFMYVVIFSSGFFLGTQYSAIITALSVGYTVTAFYDLNPLIHFFANETYKGHSIRTVIDRSLSYSVSFALVFLYKKATSIYRSEINELEKKNNQLQRVHENEQMVAGFAHEINNPLTIIDGICDEGILVNKTIASEGIEQIKMATKRISSIMKRLSDTHTSELNLKSNQIELRSQLSHLCEYVKSKYPKPQTIIITVPAGQYFNVITNDFNTVISEVVKNSIEANLQAGAQDIVISFDAEKDILTIEDFGVSIAPDKIKLLTYLFSTTKMDIPGRGVGLYLVSSSCHRNKWLFEITPTDTGTKVSIDFSISAIEKRKRILRKRAS